MNNFLELIRPHTQLNNNWDLSVIKTTGHWGLNSHYAVSDFASATIASATLAMAELIGASPKDIEINHRLASLWFNWTLHPHGWDLPSSWDPLSGNYLAGKNWVRVHTNALAHKNAAMKVLGSSDDKAEFSNLIKGWDAEALEEQITQAGGCASVMRTPEAWAKHPQGRSVASEPLILWKDTEAPARQMPTSGSMLQGIKVLDMTRVLAGPIATRFLSAFGAEVLRIDPSHWDEPGLEPEITVGKTCAGLSLNNAEDRKIFEHLLKDADILVHGYRPGALEKLGYDIDTRRKLNPNLIDISLNAYGWTGPWSKKRGFDSVVQMASGICHFSMQKECANQPVALPVQALDHGTGYLMAAAAIKALDKRRHGIISTAKLSLARTGNLLTEIEAKAIHSGFDHHFSDDDLSSDLEITPWGSAQRVKFPVQLLGVQPKFITGACRLRSSSPNWRP